MEFRVYSKRFGSDGEPLSRYVIYFHNYDKHFK